MHDSEPALVTAWQQGDEQAVRAIFNQHYPHAVKLAALSGLTLDEAQDCAQEAFLRAFESRQQLRDPVAFPFWFRRIVTRHILNALKSGQRNRQVPLEQADVVLAVRRNCLYCSANSYLLANMRLPQ